MMRTLSPAVAFFAAIALVFFAGRPAFGQSVPPPPVIVVVADNDNRDRNDNDGNDNDGNDNDGGRRRTVVREVVRTIEVPIAAPLPPVIPAAPPPPVVEAVTPPPVIPAAPPPPVVFPQVAAPRTGDGSTLGQGLNTVGSVVSAPSVSGFSSVTTEAVIPLGFPRTGGDEPQ